MWVLIEMGYSTNVNFNIAFHKSNNLNKYKLKLNQFKNFN